MAFQAVPSGMFFQVSGTGRNTWTCIEKPLVTTQAVCMHGIFAGIFDKYDLGFPAESEDGGMPQAVLCLEEIFIEHIVVRYMAIVAVGYPAMGTVRPGGVLRCHDVAVGAGRGLV